MCHGLAHGGTTLLLLAVFITLLEYIWGFDGGTHEDKQRIRRLPKNNADFKLSNFIRLFISFGGIVLGGLLIVFSTENFSAISGYSTTVLGLSLTAIATSLPELFTTVFSQRGNDEKLTLGNIIGSNIYNLTLIGGISAFFSYKVDLPTTDWLWFIASTIIILLIVKLFKKNVVPKIIGLFLLMLFVFYMAMLAGTR